MHSSYLDQAGLEKRRRTVVLPKKSRGIKFVLAIPDTGEVLSTPDLAVLTEHISNAMVQGYTVRITPKAPPKRGEIGG